MIELSSASVDETIEAGRTLAQALEPGDVVLLDGELGAGKTHFSKGVAAGLGSTAQVTSPTFNLLIEYHDGRIPLYHFDLYRLEDAEELEDIDFYGVVEGDGASLVEWAGKFADAMPDECLAVDICVDGDGQRVLRFEGRGPRGAELESRLAALLPS